MTTPAHPRTAPDGERAGNRIAARLLAPALDRRLAAGASPDESVLLAARARLLSSRAQRQRLTRCWLGVLERAARKPAPLSARTPLRRGAIAAAQGDIRLMLAVVQGTPAIRPQGLALARALLTDGAGPLYNRRSGADLAAAIRDATRRMRSR
jgi:hypothetical protein